VLARKKGMDNEWSGPVALGTGGMGWGAQIGGSKTNAVVVLNSYSAIKAFAGNAQVKLGGDLSVAAGPIGRSAAADVRVGKGLAACYSYSHSSGLFAGIALEGAVLITLDKENAKFYGRKTSPKEILYGDVRAPHNKDLQYIYETLNQFAYEGSWDEETTASAMVNDPPGPTPGHTFEPAPGYIAENSQPTPVPPPTDVPQISPEPNGLEPIPPPSSVPPPTDVPQPSYPSSPSPGESSSPRGTSLSSSSSPRSEQSPRGSQPFSYLPSGQVPQLNRRASGEASQFSAPSLPSRPGQREDSMGQTAKKARANFDYDSREPGDLSFKSGDILMIHKLEGDWWEAEKDGMRGHVPSNYVSLL